MAYPPDRSPQRSAPRYRPSAEADRAYLVQWTEETLTNPGAMSELGRRYHEALSSMEDHQALRFLVTWLLASGLSLPPFPDQQ